MQKVVGGKRDWVLWVHRLIGQWTRIYQTFGSNNCTEKLLICDICTAYDGIDGLFGSFYHHLVDATEVWGKRRVEVPFNAIACCFLLNRLSV